MTKKNKQEHKRFLNETKRQFLLSFFDEEEGYEEKNINGFWLIKQWDGNYERWTVHLYSQESYDNYKDGQQTFYENGTGYLDQEFLRKINS